ncbi:MAG: hypothetical protein J5I98_10260 [Phaeodactylibacter sp.]|nr:hypothetical protein [Phaeodactylibacter sp.]
MKYISTLLFAILLNGAAFGQLGLNATYRANDAPDWQYNGAAQGAQDLLPASHIGFGLDYWLPMKAYRIDFLPELNFQKTNNTIELADFPGQAEAQLSNTWLSFFFNANIYFLDLEGDCDCPTFSKSGGFLQKGLFLQVSPGVSWIQSKVESEGIAADSDDIALSAAVGLGLDIGLSDILTLTPIAGYRYYLPTRWESLGSEAFITSPSGDTGIQSEESSIRQFYAGLRLGLRLDQR